MKKQSEEWERRALKFLGMDFIFHFVFKKSNLTSGQFNIERLASANACCIKYSSLYGLIIKHKNNNYPKNSQEIV